MLKWDSVPWEQVWMYSHKVYASAEVGRPPRGKAPIRTMTVLEQVIPPGGTFGKHRHAAEEVHKVLRGRGYDVQDGMRYDWEAEDEVCVPILTTHQHCNASHTEPAIFYAVQPRLYDFIGHGGYEHFENAYP